MVTRSSLWSLAGVAAVALVLVLALAWAPPAIGQTNCDGSYKNDSGGGASFTAPDGSIIYKVVIKAGSEQSGGGDFTFTSDGDDGCYHVSGIGTQSANAGGGGSGPDCKDISHVTFYYKCTEQPTPTETSTNIPTPTETATNTPVPTPTQSPLPSPTPTNTNTPVPTPTQSPLTPTPTSSPLPSPTPTSTGTPEQPTATPTTPANTSTPPPRPTLTPTRRHHEESTPTPTSPPEPTPTATVPPLMPTTGGTPHNGVAALFVVATALIGLGLVLVTRGKSALAAVTSWLHRNRDL